MEKEKEKEEGGGRGREGIESIEGKRRWMA